MLLLAGWRLSCLLAGAVGILDRFGQVLPPFSDQPGMVVSFAVVFDVLAWC